MAQEAKDVKNALSDGSDEDDEPDDEPDLKLKEDNSDRESTGGGEDDIEQFRQFQAWQKVKKGKGHSSTSTAKYVLPSKHRYYPQSD